MIPPINKSMYAMIGGFIVILIIFLVFLTIWYSTSRQELLQLSTIDQYRQAAKSVGDMRQAALHRSVLLHEMTLVEDFFDRDDKYQEFREEAGYFMLARNNFLSLELSKADRELWSVIAGKVNINSRGQVQVAQLILDGEINKARQLLYETSMPGQLSILHLLSQLLDQQNKMVADKLKMADENKAHSDYIIAALAIIAILITIGIIFFVVRITIRIQNDLRKADQALIANKMKSDFLSSMSHELRTPLNAILGFGQLLYLHDGEISNEEAQENIKDILWAGNHLLDLVNGVLELSSIEAGRLNIKLEAIPLQKTIKTCINQITTSLTRQNNITLIDEIDNPDQAVLADTQRLRQVIFNLLSNAVKYNHKNGKVTVKTELLDEARLRIMVIDTGKGIKAANMNKLFDPFERLSYKNSNVEGTGIGLTVTKQLVDAMNGTVGVKSIVNKGTTFWVDLPIATIPNQASEAP